MRRSLVILAVILSACSQPAPKDSEVVDLDPSLPGEHILSGRLSASGPIPSPDGKRIAFTGHGIRGADGIGRFKSTGVLVMDARGHLLTAMPLASATIAGWTPDGEKLACLDGWSCFLLTLEGERSNETRLSEDGLVRDQTGRMWGAATRATYFATKKSFVWVQAGPDTVVRSSGQVLAKHPYVDPSMGELIVPSSDERFFTVTKADYYREAPLYLYGFGPGKWTNLGNVVIFPQWHVWERCNAGWTPWSADGKLLAFATPDNSVIAVTPDGTKRTKIANLGATRERCPGLVALAPDGRWVAWVAFTCSVPESRFDETTVVGSQIFVAKVEEGAEPIAVTEPSKSVTYSLRWLGRQSLVFDRIDKEDRGESEIVRLNLTDEVVSKLDR